MLSAEPSPPLSEGRSEEQPKIMVDSSPHTVANDNVISNNSTFVKSDSGFVCADVLRAAAVIGMVTKNVLLRFTYPQHNSVGLALGGDWVAPLFVFAAGIRLAAEQVHVSHEVAHAKTVDEAVYTELYSFLKQLVKSFMVNIHSIVKSSSCR